VTIFEIVVRVTADVVYRLEAVQDEDARMAAVSLAYADHPPDKMAIRTVTCVPRCDVVGKRHLP